MMKRNSDFGPIPGDVAKEALSFKAFTDHIIREIARGQGVPVEQLAEDMPEADYQASLLSMPGWQQRMNSIQVPGRLLNVPLLVSQDEAELMLGVVNGSPSAFLPFLFGDNRPKSNVENGVAVIPITGGLIYRGYGWSWRTTYNDIRQQLRAALADPEVDSILLDIDSPGGEVAGCFDLVDEIHAARGQKPIIASANESAYSAAYAIASAADKLYLSRTAGVGSVGVIAIHYQQAKLEADVGVKYTAIYAGARKNDFSVHEALSKEGAATIQASVDRTYDLFASTVARNRGIEVDAIKKLEAGIFDGDTAIDAGLADEVKPFAEVMSDLVRSNTTFIKGGNQMKLEEIQAGLEAVMGDDSLKAGAVEMLKALGFVPEQDAQSAENLGEQLAGAETKGREAETARAASIVESCNVAGMGNMAPQLIRERVSVEDAGKRLLEMRHGKSQSGEVGGTLTQDGGSAGECLLADAKKRAAAAENK